MCTVSIMRRDKRLVVTMNRDEARFRGPEHPPVVHEGNGVEWAGPIDTDSGGTWMGVNTYGVTGSLMNVYEADMVPSAERPAGKFSRGEIIPACLSEGSFEAAEAWADSKLTPERYQPFMLLLTAPHRAVRFRYVGEGSVEKMVVEGPESFLTSTSLDRAAVQRWRDDAFQDWKDRGRPFDGAIPTFHTSRKAGEEALSVLMDREWSATRSITQVEMDMPGGRVIMRYWPVAGGKVAGECASVELPLTNQVSSSR